jgi:hypothetical protein
MLMSGPLDGTEHTAGAASNGNDLKFLNATIAAFLNRTITAHPAPGLGHGRAVKASFRSFSPGAAAGTNK